MISIVFPPPQENAPRVASERGSGSLQDPGSGFVRRPRPGETPDDHRVHRRGHSLGPDGHQGEEVRVSEQGHLHVPAGRRQGLGRDHVRRNGQVKDQHHYIRQTFAMKSAATCVKGAKPERAFKNDRRWRCRRSEMFGLKETYFL